MPLESRSRMISFRLTDEEYDRFRSLCLARGLRNVSELIRAAVNQLIAETGDDFQTLPQPLEMQHRVSVLESRMAELASIVTQMEHRLSPDPPSNRDHRKFLPSANYDA